VYGKSQAAWRVDGLSRDLENWHAQSGGAISAASGDMFRRDLGFYDKYHLAGNEILYLGFEYWSESTKSWDRIDGAGPTFHWESKAESALWKGLGHTWPRRPALSTKQTFRDMGFPRAIRVSLTIAQAYPLNPLTHTLEITDSSASTLFVASSDGFPESFLEPNFAKLDDEWIEYGVKTENMLLNCTRGARGTLATEHRAGTRVQAGVSFSRITSIPAGR